MLSVPTLRFAGSVRFGGHLDIKGDIRSLDCNSYRDKVCGGFLKLGVRFWGPHNKE